MLSLIFSPPNLGGVRGGMNQGHTKLAFSQINESFQSEGFGFAVRSERTGSPT